ncbi:MAG: helix-turn-helix transcriptional regulator [Acidimicrobiales bacterium]|nr:helix-turn-helix transcriptional regulator [Acidimicrobiales bacterium]
MVSSVYRQAAVRGPAAALLRRRYTFVVGDDQRTLVPDGCVDLVWIPSFGRLVVCGAEARGWRIDLPIGTRAVGVRFHPGVGPAALGSSGRELAERRVPIDEVCGRRGARLTQQVLEAGDPAAELEVLERFVAGLDAEAEPLVGAVLGRLLRRADRSVPELADAVGLSSRQLQRRTVEAFGYGPVVLARIVRLQRFLHLLVHSDRPLVELAARCGYADQSHLVRECRAIAGVTPTRVRPEVAGLDGGDGVSPLGDLFAPLA